MEEDALNTAHDILGHFTEQRWECHNSFGNNYTAFYSCMFTVQVSPPPGPREEGEAGISFNTKTGIRTANAL